MERINPYYNPEKLGLSLLSFDEPNLCYEYNTLCFWKTEDGRIYTASDSGCSCPTPFEQYAGTTLDEVLQQLERIGSLEQAERIFESWNDNGRLSISSNGGELSISSKNELTEWIKDNLKIA